MLNSVLGGESRGVFRIEGENRCIYKSGEGNYGKVYRGLHKQSAQQVAIKIVPVVGDIQNLLREILILKDCQNEHIVKYYGSYLFNNELWLIMEYCSEGSILDIMQRRKSTLK